ncbi:MAG TPA: hypothetical protein VFK05_07605 [Polyangiaceae bacterium]|nr:hypothetical protein [Polyangiaceae bacterium]
MVSVRRVSALGMLVVFCSMLVLSSCLFDANARCDDDQIYDSSAGLCVCKDNTIPGTNPDGSPGCVACKEHELSSHDTCVCEEGYQRPSPEGACELVPEAQGLACQSDTDCTDATYDTCHMLDDGSGYCTNVGCATGECNGGYACDTVATPPYCARPPNGAGKSCATDADCAGTEATWCDSFVTHVCYVQGCALDGNDCPGKECCDLAVKSGGIINKTICVDLGTCQGGQ